VTRMPGRPGSTPSQIKDLRRRLRAWCHRVAATIERAGAALWARHGRK
jgi:hypothetical protein